MQTKTFSVISKGMHQLKSCKILRQSLPDTETYSFQSSQQLLVYLISKQALVHSICTHAQCILQSQVHCKGSEPLPQSPDALFLDNSLTTVPNACKPRTTGAILHRVYTAHTQQHLRATVSHLCTCQHGQAAVWS